MKKLLSVGKTILSAEFFASIALLLFLPPKITLPFSFILTSGETFGSSWNLLAMPACTLIVLMVWGALAKFPYIPKWLVWLSGLVGGVVIAGTVFYLCVVAAQVL